MYPVLPEWVYCGSMTAEKPRIGEKTNTKRARLRAEILSQWDKGDKPIAQIAKSLSCGDNTVRRVLDEGRPGERQKRLQERAQATTRICTGCGEELALDQFPLRADRKGKTSSMCFACHRDWRRQMGRKHQPRNTEGNRRRRARIRRSRTFHYRDVDVYERDGYICFRCGEPIDPTLKHPDPNSGTIDHKHPVAKWGPDTMENVAGAHLICNQRAKDNYTNPFANWVVSRISNTLARAIVTEHHYLHRAGPTSYAYGLFDSDDELRGVVCFGSCTSKRIRESVSDDPDIPIHELSRLWVADDTPFGAATWMLSRALKQMPRSIIISYADNGVVDPRYNTAHSGGVYRAASFSYSGTSKPAIEYRMPGLSRSVPRDTPGAVPSLVTPKSRYWTVTGSKTDKKVLRSACKWPIMNYKDSVGSIVVPGVIETTEETS